MPEDIAVAGFDDITEGRYSNPRLTTVSPDMPFLISEVLRLLGDLISGRGREVEDIVVPWSLRVRESTVGVTTRGGTALEVASAPTTGH